MQLFLNFDYWNWVVIPVLIFLARMTDVSLATLRHIMVNKGMKRIVPFLGFFEVLIWLMAITQVMQNLTNVACYIAWASGFSTGTYLGMVIEEKIALGYQIVRIITNQQSEELIEELKKQGHGVTVVPAVGALGPVKMVFTIVKRKDVSLVIKQIKEFNPQSFFTVEDVRNTSAGVFSNNGGYSVIGNLFTIRKGK
jgi:uncharacterized protein YebE (UPF0316 family)